MECKGDLHCEVYMSEQTHGALHCQYFALNIQSIHPGIEERREEERQNVPRYSVTSTITSSPVTAWIFCVLCVKSSLTQLDDQSVEILTSLCAPQPAWAWLRDKNISGNFPLFTELRNTARCPSATRQTSCVLTWEICRGEGGG